MIQKHHIQDSWFVVGTLAGMLFGWQVAPSSSGWIAPVATIAAMGYFGFMASTLLWTYAEPSIRSWLPGSGGSDAEEGVVEQVTVEERSK